MTKKLKFLLTLTAALLSSPLFGNPLTYLDEHNVSPTFDLNSNGPRAIYSITVGSNATAQSGQADTSYVNVSADFTAGSTVRSTDYDSSAPGVEYAEGNVGFRLNNVRKINDRWVAESVETNGSSGVPTEYDVDLGVGNITLTGYAWAYGDIFYASHTGVTIAWTIPPVDPDDTGGGGTSCTAASGTVNGGNTNSFTQTLDLSANTDRASWNLMIGSNGIAQSGQTDTSYISLAFSFTANGVTRSVHHDSSAPGVDYAEGYVGFNFTNIHKDPATGRWVAEVVERVVDDFSSSGGRSFEYNVDLGTSGLLEFSGYAWAYGDIYYSSYTGINGNWTRPACQ